MEAIDLFAGAGGLSEGAKMAGVRVVWAANHWRAAVEVHALNHPNARHECQDLHQANWALVPRHDLLLAAPCCQGHSKARGRANGNPQHDASRSTAWAVVAAVEYHRPEFVVVENVPEFVHWSLYPAWRMAMEALGYSLAPHIIDAADHGVPQNRQRLFIVCARSRAPLMLMWPPHFHVAVETVIDFDSGNWSPVYRPGRSPATIARIERGRKELKAERFVIPFYGSGSGLTGRSIKRPLGTVTTRDRWAIVDGDRMRMLSATEYRAAMGFPDRYVLPTEHRLAVHMLGNAVCPPVARDIIEAIKVA